LAALRSSSVLRRRKERALRSQHARDFYSALAIVAKSDLILTAPAALARLVPNGLAVVALKPPLRMPRHSINLVWHERFSKEPDHTWLRGMVTEVARA